MIPYKSKECENYFMIRHNRIYTNVVLNKINDVNVMFAKVVMRAGWITQTKQYGINEMHKGFVHWIDSLPGDWEYKKWNNNDKSNGGKAD